MRGVKNLSFVNSPTHRLTPRQQAACQTGTFKEVVDTWTGVLEGLAVVARIRNVLPCALSSFGQAVVRLHSRAIWVTCEQRAA